MQLTEKTDLWRMVGTYDGGKAMQAVYTRIPCVRVPISSFDTIAAALSSSMRSGIPSEYFRAEGRDSTDVFILPDWLQVQTDDELRRGRRVDINGTAVAYRYTVAGIRTFESFAYQDQQAAFCQLMT